MRRVAYFWSITLAGLLMGCGRTFVGAPKPQPMTKNAFIAIYARGGSAHGESVPSTETFSWDGSKYLRIDTDEANKTSFAIKDCKQGTEWFFNENTHTCLHRAIDPATSTGGPFLLDETKLQRDGSFLGTEKVDGQECRHYRIDNVGPLEYWYCPALGCCMKSTSGSDILGNYTERLSNYRKISPDPRLLDPQICLKGYREVSSNKEFYLPNKP